MQEPSREDLDALSIYRCRALVPVASNIEAMASAGRRVCSERIVWVPPNPLHDKGYWIHSDRAMDVDHTAQRDVPLRGTQQPKGSRRRRVLRWLGLRS